MKVVLHTGAHLTDEGRLASCLSANSSAIEEFGTHFPNPNGYRKLLRDFFTDSFNSIVNPDSCGALRDTILDGAVSDRLIMSNSSFFGTPKMAARAGVLYSAADTRLGLCQKIFAPDDIEIFMSICNLATFLPAVFEKAGFDNIAEFLDGTDPTTMRWAEMFQRIRALYPDIAITVWCNEDTPLIWGQLIRKIAGVESTMPIMGEFTLLSEIMSEVGMKRFLGYVESRPNLTESQKSQVIVAFLDKFAEPDAIETELDVPGWTEQLVDQLTRNYDEDVDAIQKIPGVTMITP